MGYYEVIYKALEIIAAQYADQQNYTRQIAGVSQLLDKAIRTLTTDLGNIIKRAFNTSDLEDDAADLRAVAGWLNQYSNPPAANPHAYDGYLGDSDRTLRYIMERLAKNEDIKLAGVLSYIVAASLKIGTLKLLKDDANARALAQEAIDYVSDVKEKLRALTVARVSDKIKFLFRSPTHTHAENWGYDIDGQPVDIASSDEGPNFKQNLEGRRQRRVNDFLEQLPFVQIDTALAHWRGFLNPSSVYLNSGDTVFLVSKNNNVLISNQNGMEVHAGQNIARLGTNATAWTIMGVHNHGALLNDDWVFIRSQDGFFVGTANGYGRDIKMSPNNPTDINHSDEAWNIRTVDGVHSVSLGSRVYLRSRRSRFINAEGGSGPKVSMVDSPADDEIWIIQKLYQ